MNLSDFLLLSEEEKKLEKELVDLINNNSTSELIFEKVLACKEKTLFKLAITNPEIDKLLKSKDLTSYWNDLWRRAGINPAGTKCITNKPLHEYLPIATVPSLDLLKGLFIYEAFKVMVANETTKQSELIEQGAEYLLLSSNLGCFFAQNALCRNGLKLLSSQFNAELAGVVISIAQKSAEQHWTPGYLLLANVYKELSKYEENFIAGGLSIAAYQALIAAKTLEPKSGPMLNNAYQGKSITEASEGQFKSFFQMRAKFVSDLNINLTTQSLAERKASLDAGKITREYPTQQPAGINDDIENADTPFDHIPNF